VADTGVQPGSVDGIVRRARAGGLAAWVIRLRSTAIVLHLDGRGLLHLGYWGADGGSWNADDYLVDALPDRETAPHFLEGRPLAYPAYGDPSYREPCLVVVQPDGERELALSFTADRLVKHAGRPMLELELRDPRAGVRLMHELLLYGELDLLVWTVHVANYGERPLTLERVLSGSLPLPAGRYDCWMLRGRWGGEFQLERQELGHGAFVIGSRRGISSAEAHPWLAIAPRGETAEHTGRVWFASLAWSGNWTAMVELERGETLAASVGLQPFDFAWHLEPGERFSAPALVLGHAVDGLGGAARRLHDLERTVALPAAHRSVVRPVLYNSWEATYFDVRADQQIALARRAAELGVELFVVDDGWFGARDHDRAGLGDWRVNRRKFPRGLRPLIDEVHRLGMLFGIWVEAEMVNPDSDLFRAHPDWAYLPPSREPLLSRNQLVLNFARADVRAAILDQLHALLTEDGRIDFLKWDHNRPWLHVGWPEHPDRGREAWVRHVLGLYELLQTLRAEFPELLIETCSSGGARADLGMLALTDQAWVSDNTDAADRLPIQYGYSHAHSPSTMVNWVTDVPNHQTGRVSPLEFRFHVAMQGVLGIGGNISRWSEEEVQQAQRLVADYKRIRTIVQLGEQYWLLPPPPVGPCAVQYVSPDRRAVVLLLYQVRGGVGAGVPRVRLMGLDPARRYRRERDGAESTGAALMAAGLPVRFEPTQGWHPAIDYRSALQVWHAIDAR